MAFRDSINDLMFRFYERFKQNNNRLPVSAEELEQKIDALKQSIESGVQLKGSIQEFAVSSWDEIAPDEVPAGSVAILIGTNDIRQTDGKEWLPI